MASWKFPPFRIPPPKCGPSRFGVRRGRLPQSCVGTKVLLKHVADPRKNIFRHLTLSFAAKMNKVNELLVVAVQMRMCIHQADRPILRGEFPHDDGMDC